VPPPRVLAVGEGAALVRFGAAVHPAANAAALALLRALDAAPPPGLVDLVPAYASLLVLFDPLAATPAAVTAAVRAALGAAPPAAEPPGRLVHIPVTYGGPDGPDLDDLARHAGLGVDEVIRRHAAARYRVYFLGFLAGFPYLGGLPSALAMPRLPTPRPLVPAGSVALAGRQAGVYPVASPGGWRLIGRTDRRLFDPAQDPPALLRPGDRVRFVPVAPARGPAALPPDDGSGATPPADAPPAGSVPWLCVVRPGPLTTVQDLGRPGYARYGVSRSGAAADDALRLGNALLGNPEGAAALEVTLGGAAFAALAPCAVAVTGADCGARAGGRPLRPGVVAALATGEALELAAARDGARAYVCVAGGVAVALVLGSRSTDVRAGLGGLEGRALRPGDTLARGEAAGAPAALAGRRAPADPAHRRPPDGVWRLRVLAGPGDLAGADDAATDAELRRLAAARYLVDARSDRVGVRLRWQGDAAAARPRGGEALSEGVPRGAVQVPPDGEPILLLADHQATGGYRVPAIVVAADRWMVGQLRPGDAVALEPATRPAAVAALAERRRWLSEVRAAAERWRGAGSDAIDPATLARGFAEWSEEDGDGE
jgi:KipI family sensor histidine kinase inhibitor